MTDGDVNDGSTTKESDEVAVDHRHSCGLEKSLPKENPVQESTQRFKAVKVTDFGLCIVISPAILSCPDLHRFA